MHKIAYILALHLAVCSTQPAWQPLKEWLFSGCGGQAWEADMACSPTPLQSCPTDQDSQSTGCCVPFQCCFPVCCFCVKPEALALSHPAPEKNIRPGEQTETLHSQCSAEHFQPPETA